MSEVINLTIGSDVDPQDEIDTAINDLETLKLAHPLALQLKPRLLLARLLLQSGRADARLRELETLVADASGSVVAAEA